MRNAGKTFRVLMVLALTIALGTLIGWLVSRQGDVAPVGFSAPTNNPPVTVAETSSVTPAPAVSRAVQIGRPNEFHRVGGNPENWDEKLETILLGSDDENSKADKLLALIPQAPAENRAELAQHLCNLVQSDHYNGAAEMLTNASTPSDVSGVLMNDLLNRDNSLKLPMLLAIARNDTHPLKDQALDLLGLITQEDKGTNWDQWSSTVDTWMQNNSQ